MSDAGRFMRCIAEGYVFWCPGCNERHMVYVDEPHPIGSAQWAFDGNLDAPTFSPSINYVGRCHFFVRNGRIEYCADSRHALAGKTVSMVPIDDEWQPIAAEQGEEK